MRKSHLILEISEFNLQRMNTDNIPMAVHVDNPELSMDAFDKHIANIQTSNIKLNNILNTLSSVGGIFNFRKDKIEDGLDIRDLKILRMYPSNDINLDIYISFTLSDIEYYGVISNFMDATPRVNSEAFRDPGLYGSREWIIKIKGLLIKAIRSWMIVKSGEYVTLKDINCVTKDTGEFVEIKSGTKMKVIRNFDNDKIIIDVNGINCYLSGVNFFYFNYWFKKLD